jgi:hypothetical protein
VHRRVRAPERGRRGERSVEAGLGRRDGPGHRVRWGTVGLTHAPAVPRLRRNRRRGDLPAGIGALRSVSGSRNARRGHEVLGVCRAPQPWAQGLQPMVGRLLLASVSSSCRGGDRADPRHRRVGCNGAGGARSRFVRRDLAASTHRAGHRPVQRPGLRPIVGVLSGPLHDGEHARRRAPELWHRSGGDRARARRDGLVQPSGSVVPHPRRRVRTLPGLASGGDRTANTLGRSAAARARLDLPFTDLGRRSVDPPAPAE